MSTWFPKRFKSSFIPDTKALLMLIWSKYLMKYPKEANVMRTMSSLSRKWRSSGDLSSVSQRYDFHVALGLAWIAPAAPVVPSAMLTDEVGFG